MTSQSVMAKKLRHDDYTVGWIAAITIELAAAMAALDETHETLSSPQSDHNTYAFGRIGNHNIVIACLPKGEYGTSSATQVAADMKSTFKSIRFGLMVGIGGGIPNNREDICLGDVVISTPTETSGGVVQYDYGKAEKGKFERTGMLNRPPTVLLTALSALQGIGLNGKNKVAGILAEIQKAGPHLARPEAEDHLYFADYVHVNKQWQGYASAVAAAYAKALLLLVHDIDKQMQTAQDALSGSGRIPVVEQPAKLESDEFHHDEPVVEQPATLESDKFHPDEVATDTTKLHSMGQKLPKWSYNNYWMLIGFLLIVLLALAVQVISPTFHSQQAAPTNNTREDFRDAADRYVHPAAVPELNLSIPIFAVMGRHEVGKSSFIDLAGGINVPPPLRITKRRTFMIRHIWWKSPVLGL
ncbi:Pfs, NB-ARC and TPR domain protein [Talaromyces pinophilus]|uniref:Pfs, NB-ARC and TPR domain protein n=1 Tax=Talaromyces pinophilus TaxID=128442 RepID=A0A6V8H399_TALPI|nr:Pfs, NB-ARC and TPR domain protein [Talaromyces pinophilus]